MTSRGAQISIGQKSAVTIVTVSTHIASATRNFGSEFCARSSHIQSLLSKLRVPGYNNFVLGRPVFLANQKRRYMTSLTDCLSVGTSAIKSEEEPTAAGGHTVAAG